MLPTRPSFVALWQLHVAFSQINGIQSERIDVHREVLGLSLGSLRVVLALSARFPSQRRQQHPNPKLLSTQTLLPSTNLFTTSRPKAVTQHGHLEVHALHH